MRAGNWLISSRVRESRFEAPVDTYRSGRRHPLSGVQMVELFCARFRQEDAFRDLKQRLGREEGRAWTRNPIERTTQAVLTTLTALRLLQLELQDERGDDWWLHPPWNPGKTRPSVLDVGRLLREHREELQRGLAEWLNNRGNTGG